MNVFIVAVASGYREQVQLKILTIDASARFENVKGLETFWVGTKLTNWSIECIPGVAQVYASIREPLKFMREVQN